MSASWWPMRLSGPQNVVLRPLLRTDAGAFDEVREANREWLRPWDATIPGTSELELDFRLMRRSLNSQARKGRALPFAIEVDGDFRGQVTVSGIQWGSISSAQIGYWIDSRVAGRGIVPLAVAMATDACFFELGLHRVEINIRPENDKSLRVVDKLGFRFEGVRRGYMHIAGEWADHRSYALLNDEVPGGLTRAFARDQGWA